MSQRPDLSAVFRWALDASASPTSATHDWLASEIVPGCGSAASAIASTSTTLEQLNGLKAAFKALRQGGATAAERNRAARLYAATIAAAMLRFSARITRNSDRALRDAFAALRDDETMEEPLRDIARAALRMVAPD
ncbi:MAG: hypothetical protein U0572_07985 [Phycisphaerales bacterium]